MPPLVCLFIEGCGKPAVGFWRDNRGDAVFSQLGPQPISVKRAVSQHVTSAQAVNEIRHRAQIMRLPGHQAEIDEVSQRIRQSQYLGRYPTTRSPYGLAQSPPFAP